MLNTLSINYAMRPEYRTNSWDLDIQVNPLDATDDIPAGYVREYRSEYSDIRFASPARVSRPDYPYGSENGFSWEG
jgi:hypothetical protein